LCIQTTGCHAISRRASAGESSSNCWLETSTAKSSDKPGAAYRTFVKPSKSPESASATAATAAAAAVPAPAAAADAVFPQVSTQSDDMNVLYVTDDDLKLSNSNSGGTTLFAGPGVPVEFKKQVQVSTNFAVTFWIKRGSADEPYHQLVRLQSSGDADNWEINVPSAGTAHMACSVYVRRYQCITQPPGTAHCKGKFTFQAYKSTNSNGCLTKGRWAYMALVFTPNDYEIRVNGLPHMKGFFPTPIPEMQGTKTLSVGPNLIIEPSTGKKIPLVGYTTRTEIAQLVYHNSASYGSAGPKALLTLPQGVGKYVAADDVGGCKLPVSAYPTQNGKGLCMPIGKSPMPYCVNEGSNTTCIKSMFQVKNLNDLVYGIHLHKTVHCYPGNGGNKTCQVSKSVSCYAHLEASWSWHNDAFKNAPHMHRQGNKCPKGLMTGEFAANGNDDVLLLFLQKHNFAACNNLINATVYRTDRGFKRVCSDDCHVKHDCPLYPNKLAAQDVIKQLIRKTSETAMTA